MLVVSDWIPRPRIVPEAIASATALLQSVSVSDN